MTRVTPVALIIMSNRSFRKRRRTQEEPGGDPQLEGADDVEHTKDTAAPQDGEDEAEKACKQQDVWDAFREENYEVLEQLPLSLHRSFTLIFELDQQVQDYTSRILSSLKQYVSMRKKLAGLVGDTQSVEAAEHPDVGDSSRVSEIRDVEIPVVNGVDGGAGPRSSPAKETRHSPMKSASSSEPAESPDTTRRLLAHVAQLEEEIVRASNEKYNVAQFAYDIVDRYIRDLDRTIKEQEASISLRLRPGTHPAAIILPELILPKSARPRVEFSPSMPVVESAEGHVTPAADSGEPTLGIVAPEAPTEGAAPAHPRRRSRSKWSRKKAPPKGKDEVEKGPEKPEVSGAPSGLKLTVPPLAAVALQPGDMPANPFEPRYCYCDQVSYGEMIACDNPGCKREWFHLGCAGFAQAPKGKWFCRDCSEAVLSDRSLFFDTM
ncbi:Inhibitor of growth protein 4 [Grifola frondosa]|uniref:Chromatin modification-related protein n=1 Tax=Grifola frondosa TaxID=5627 RepID=A0A1C7ML19_GRIFR|nr:Inhibitor of growth protein 4 [Grifola frondosa]